MSVRRSAAPPHLTGASYGAPGTLRGPAIALNPQSLQTVPTDGWRFFGKERVPKPTPVPKPQPLEVPQPRTFAPKPQPSEAPQPRTFAPKIHTSFQQKVEDGRWKFEVDFTKGYKVGNITYHRTLLHAKITIAHNINSVFYPEVLGGARVAMGALSPQEAIEIKVIAFDFMQKKYAELDSIIERDFPENKNRARPEVKKLQDKVDDAASFYDFYRAIELALTRIPDAIYEKDADGKYVKNEYGMVREPTPTFVETWFVDAANVALMEAVSRAWE